MLAFSIPSFHPSVNGRIYIPINITIRGLEWINETICKRGFNPKPSKEKNLVLPSPPPLVEFFSIAPHLLGFASVLIMFIVSVHTSFLSNKSHLVASATSPMPVTRFHSSFPQHFSRTPDSTFIDRPSQLWLKHVLPLKHVLFPISPSSLSNIITSSEF